MRVAAALLAIMLAGCTSQAGTTVTSTQQAPPPSIGDDPYGLIDHVTWGDTHPDRPPMTLQIVGNSSEGVEFVVPGNLCPPIVSVDVLADAPAAVLRVRLDDWVPQEVECADLLVSHPVIVTFVRSVDPTAFQIELDDRRIYP